MTSPRKKKATNAPLTILLTSGGILTTLVGSNLVAGRSWVDSIVPGHQVDAALLEVQPAVVPELREYSGLNLNLPDTNQLPRPVSAPELNLSKRIVLVEQGAGSGTADGAVSVSLPEIPQIAAPVIPNRPQVNIQPVSVELAPIPQVNIPQPVTTSSSSK